MTPRKSLGRGLDALLGGHQAPPAAAETEAPASAPAPPSTGVPAKPAAARPGPVIAAIERLHPNPRQPRKHFDETGLRELAASIHEHGVIQPILVRTSPQGYEIIAGERRWRAAQLAGLHSVPVIVRETTDSDSLLIAVIENIQRADLSPVEEAQAYAVLAKEYKLTQDIIAQKVGKSRAAVANSVRILELPRPVRELVDTGKVPATAARALLAFDTAAEQIGYAEAVAHDRYTVRDLERLAKIAKARHQPDEPAGAPAPAAPAPPNPNTRALEQELERLVGARVTLHHKNPGGRVEITYHSLDELDRLVAILRKGGR